VADPYGRSLGFLDRDKIKIRQRKSKIVSSQQLMETSNEAFIGSAVGWVSGQLPIPAVSTSSEDSLPCIG
jgi:hypothetical protein